MTQSLTPYSWCAGVPELCSRCGTPALPREGLGRVRVAHEPCRVPWHQSDGELHHRPLLYSGGGVTARATAVANLRHLFRRHLVFREQHVGDAFAALRTPHRAAVSAHLAASAAPAHSAPDGEPVSRLGAHQNALLDVHLREGRRERERRQTTRAGQQQARASSSTW